MYLWDEILDLWDLYRSQLVLGVLAVMALSAGLFTYHKVTCCTRRPPLQCMLLDASGSARGARETYNNIAKSIVLSQSERDGSVCFVDVAGDPAANSNVDTVYVGAENLSNSSTAALERSEHQIKTIEQIDQLLEHPELTVPGSAFIEALAVVAPMMHRGETIHVFSDGIQDSAAFKLRDLHRGGFTEEAINASLDKLKKAGYLPRLPGINVVFEKPGFQGNGGHSIVTGPAIEHFWRAWGVKTGANVKI